MGISERREREKTERRKTILSCAIELILLHGVQRVSMEDIAKKAELSKATVYLYFSSKEILFNEICEEAARGFLDHLKPFLKNSTTGVEALRCFWQGYVKMFGSFDEMIIIFQVRHFMNPELPMVSLAPQPNTMVLCEGSPIAEQRRSYNVDAILDSIKVIIDQCKTEGVFDPDLDSNMATRLILSMFSVTIENAARMPAEIRKSPLIIEEMKNSFQIIIRGFAKEGIDRVQLAI